MTAPVGYAVDLHTHSLRSDGALAPAELVRRAAARGVRVMALSDHDTLAGLAEAVAAGEEHGVELVPATELNTESEWGDVHVLGYFLDPADAALEDTLRDLREKRRRRVERMVEALAAMGYPLELARVLEIAQGGSLGRPHLAQALFEAGHVASYDAAFATVLAKGSPAYVAREGLAPLEAVRLVREHGGLPALAHPGTAVRLEELLPRLVGEGLAGIECYYGEHTPHATAHYLALARLHGLVPTGGSDFHGRGDHGAPLGGVPVPEGTVDALRSRRAAPRQASGTYHVAQVERTG